MHIDKIIINKKAVILCETQLQANMLCEYLTGSKKRTEGYYGSKNWTKHLENTCYSPSRGEYGRKDYWSEVGYTVIKYDDVAFNPVIKFYEVFDTDCNTIAVCKPKKLNRKLQKLIRKGYSEFTVMPIEKTLKDYI